jgi:hypothetical protein
MISTNRFASFLAIGIAAQLCNACLDQMEPAKQALDEISNVMMAASADATKYAPDQMASVQKELADLKISYDRKNYGDVLAHAPSVLTDAKNLAADAAAKKDDIAKALNTEWNGLAASVPQRITAIKARVDLLSKTKRAPKGIDLAAAQSSLADATDGWVRAETAFASGKVEEAIATANDVNAKTVAAAAALKLELPASGK